MIVVSSGAFVVTRMLYGDQGSETGALDFLLYGLVGLVPAMMCSWLLNEDPTTECKMAEAQLEFNDQRNDRGSATAG